MPTRRSRNAIWQYRCNMAQVEYVVDQAGWKMRFLAGERESRRASGEWTGLTIADMAHMRAANQPDTVAVVGENGSLTFAQVLDEAQALARGLAAIGIKRGDTVSFQLPNWLESVVVNLACALAGYVVNPVIPIYRHAELRFILNDCRARAIFIPASFRGVDYPEMIDSLRAELPQLEHVIIARGSAEGMRTYDEIIEAGRKSDATLVAGEPDDAKFIIYTSGTTGQPKGVIYSHNQGRRPMWASMKVWFINEGDKLLMPSPVTHVTGYSYGMEGPFQFGTCTIFMEKWDAAIAADIVDREQINYTIGATPFLQELVEQAEQRGSRFPSLRIFACGGAAVPPDLVRRANRVFSACRTFRVFGSSECPMVTQGTPEDTELGATTDGRIVDYDVKIVDGEGRKVAYGQEGEILARGPCLFRGYTNMRTNEESFDAEGYFLTGDLGTVTPDGMLTITGRKKDIIIRGGENLSAKEIEDALHEHPAIREAAVVSMPHKRLGEGVCGWLVPRGEARPDATALAAFLQKQGLARQKCPERIEYIDELPKTASGKIKKHELRAWIARLVSDEAANAPKRGA